ncbi:MAG: hypothetical protein ABI625_07895 [bacterium]
MTRIAEIVKYLESESLATSVAWPTSIGPDAAIRGICADREATAGDLSWISPRVLREHPERVGAFAGSLLIAPLDSIDQGATSVLVRSGKPKLAFSLAVHRFFDVLTQVAWPLDQRRVHPTSFVSPDAELAAGVVIGADTIIEAGVRIGPNSCIANTTVRANVSIGCNCSIGLPGFGYERADNGDWVRFPHLGRVIIESFAEIGSNVCIDRGSLGETHIGRNAKIDNLVHVAHNVTVGPNALLIAHAMIGGSTTIGDSAWIAPSSAILNQLTIGARAIVGMGAVVIRDVPDGATVIGNPAKPLSRT